MSSGEFALIERFFRRPPRDPAVRLGVGDDAALIAPTPGTELAFSVDMLVEGTPFSRRHRSPALGHKSLAVNLSDMAAMGATPRLALLAGALPRLDPEWLSAFVDGLFALADRYRVELIGGDTTRGPAQPVRDDHRRGADRDRASPQRRARRRRYLRVRHAGRRGARARGAGGANAPGRGRARRRPRSARAPEPRVALGLRLRGVASAAIDVSDGLTGDLGHVLEGVGGRRDRRCRPASARCGARARSSTAPSASSRFAACSPAATITSSASRRRRSARAAVGESRASWSCRSRASERSPPTRSLVVRDEQGAELRLVPRAFDHFAS